MLGIQSTEAQHVSCIRNANQVGNWYTTFDQEDPAGVTRPANILPSQFPPSAEELASGRYPLHRCMRFFPHHGASHRQQMMSCMNRYPLLTTWEYSTLDPSVHTFCLPVPRERCLSAGCSSAEGWSGGRSQRARTCWGSLLHVAQPYHSQPP
jgi:hypothetical protein